MSLERQQQLIRCPYHDLTWHAYTLNSNDRPRRSFGPEEEPAVMNPGLHESEPLPSGHTLMAPSDTGPRANPSESDGEFRLPHSLVAHNHEPPAFLVFIVPIDRTRPICIVPV